MPLTHTASRFSTQVNDRNAWFHQKKLDRLNLPIQPDTLCMSPLDIKLYGSPIDKFNDTAARSSTYVKEKNYMTSRGGRHSSSLWNSIAQFGHNLDKTITGDASDTGQWRNQPAGYHIWGDGFPGLSMGVFNPARAGHIYGSMTLDGLNSNFGSRAPIWGRTLVKPLARYNRLGERINIFAHHPKRGMLINPGVRTFNEWRYWGESAYIFSGMLGSSVPNGINYINGYSPLSRQGSLLDIIRQDFRQDLQLSFLNPNLKFIQVSPTEWRPILSNPPESMLRIIQQQAYQKFNQSKEVSNTERKGHTSTEQIGTQSNEFQQDNYQFYQNEINHYQINTVTGDTVDRYEPTLSE